MWLAAECMHDNVFPSVNQSPSLWSYVSEREVQQQLAEIERAAKEALATDRVQNARSDNFPSHHSTLVFHQPAITPIHTYQLLTGLIPPHYYLSRALRIYPLLIWRDLHTLPYLDPWSYSSITTTLWSRSFVDNILLHSTPVFSVVLAPTLLLLQVVPVEWWENHLHLPPHRTLGHLTVTVDKGATMGWEWVIVLHQDYWGKGERCLICQQQQQQQMK